MFGTLDRTIYDQEGIWRSPNQDQDTVVFYYVKEPLTMKSRYVRNREEVYETTTIVLWGEDKIIYGDTITLETGSTLKVGSVIHNMFERNSKVSHILKPMVIDQVIQLE